MTNNKRTFSQRGDDYLLEAQRLCAEDKPAPRCPYCGHVLFCLFGNRKQARRKFVCEIL